MPSPWLPGARIVDLTGSHGDGYRQLNPLGVIAHVNQSVGNLAGFFTRSNDVCPNFQVYFDGSIEQYLPFNYRPWCQSAGNHDYDAIETEGLNTQAWTDAQIKSIAIIMAVYRRDYGVPMQVVNQPGEVGFGWHGMGGNAWGGHPNCPGEPRKAQRQTVLDLVLTGNFAGRGTEIDDMDLNTAVLNFPDFGNMTLPAFMSEVRKHVENSTEMWTDPQDIPPWGRLTPAQMLGQIRSAEVFDQALTGDLAPLIEAIKNLPAQTVAALTAALAN